MGGLNGSLVHDSVYHPGAAEIWTCSKSSTASGISSSICGGWSILDSRRRLEFKNPLDDSKLLISFSVLTSKVTRRPENSSPVEIEEPFILYFVMDKSRDRLFILSNSSAIRGPATLQSR